MAFGRFAFTAACVALAARTPALLGGCMILVVASTPAAVSAAEARQFAPSSPWSVDFADDSCKADRSFQSAGETVVLEFESLGPGSSMDVRVASNSLSSRVRTPATQFLPVAEPRTHQFYRGLDTDGWKGVALTETSIRTTEASITAYSVKNVFQEDIVLATGALDGIMKAMRQCEDDLFSSLGLDAEANRTLSRSLEITGKEKWLPVTAPMQRDFRKSKGSTFQRVRLLVDEQGKVTGCRVLGWPEDEKIARDMCDALHKSAEFAPALDARSRPIKSYYVLALSA